MSLSVLEDLLGVISLQSEWKRFERGPSRERQRPLTENQDRKPL
jgi:hypothetical protein